MPQFVKAYKKQPNRLPIRQFLVLLYDCIPNKQLLSIDRLLKKNAILTLITGKNPTTALYSETTRTENNAKILK